MRPSSSPTTSTSPVSGWSRSASAAAGHEVEGGDDVGVRARPPAPRRRSSPSGEAPGRNWRPRFSRPLAMEIDDLAGELVGVGLGGRRPRRPTRWRARRARRRRRRRCVPGLEAGDPVAPALAELVDDLRRPFPVPRPQRSPGGPTPRAGVAIPRPAGPVPPNTPMCMPESFAHRPTRPTLRASQGSRAHTPANFEMLDGGVTPSVRRRSRRWPNLARQHRASDSTGS